MKILHTSDIHLDSKMNSKLPAEKARERKRELILNFKETVEFARRKSCSAVIIAGDLFDSENVTESSKKFILGLISSFPEITFFYLPGNHEKKIISKMPSLPENLKIFGDGWTGFSFGDIYITGRCETEPDMFGKLNLPSDKAAICVLHGELRDRSDFGGIIGKKELPGSKISYLALGHYHSYSSEQIGDTYAVYSGTPAGRGFDEAGEKGFVIIDTDGGISHSFHSGFSRKIHIADVFVEPNETTVELKEKILTAVSKIPESSIIRIQLLGKRAPESRIDLKFLEKHFENSFYYFEIKDETGLYIAKEDYSHDKSLKGEFIRTVLSDGALTEREKEKIISCGLLALLGEKFED